MNVRLTTDKIVNEEEGEAKAAKKKDKLCHGTLMQMNLGINIAKVSCKDTTYMYC